MTAVDDILAEAARGGRPDGILLMRLFGETATEEDARVSLARAIASADAAGAARLDALRRVWEAHPQAWSVVRATLAAAVHDRDAVPGDILHYWADVFDRLAVASPEAGVALYSLGSPELLGAATREIVALVHRLGLLHPDHDVLDLGCGIGRLSEALAPHVRTLLGVDVSAGMIAEARRRCGKVTNVRFEQGSGRDLSLLSTDSVHLALAADVFPYLVQAGVAAHHVAEFARVLRPSGAALILNYSYRGSLDLDRAELADIASACGLTVVNNGSADLNLWDAATFLLKRPDC